MAKIKVKDIEVTVIQINNEDYICITDMIRAKDGEFFVSDWLRNRNTLEYIGIWEQIFNPYFNYAEFATIKSQAGLNSFKISVKESECCVYQRGTSATGTAYKVKSDCYSTDENIAGGRK